MATKCRCLYTCPDGQINGTCLLESGGSCFTFVEKIHDQLKNEYLMETRYGCFPPGEGTILQCHGEAIAHEVPKSIACCRDSDYCNMNLTPTKFNPKSLIEDYDTDIMDLLREYSMQLYLTIILIIVICFVLSLVSYMIRPIRKKQNLSTQSFSDSEENFITNKYPNYFIPNYNQSEYNNQFSSSVYNIHEPTGIESNTALLNESKNINVYNGQSDSSGISSFGSSSNASNHIKYSYLNGSHSSHNSNQYGMTTHGLNYYRNLSSTLSNTTSSMASENTQQTSLSSNKLTSFSSSLPPLNENSFTSGSGAGVPRLVQQTLARGIELQEMIGRGRFGEVHRGVQQCESVAVKIFFSKDEASWRREMEIYTTVNMSHDSILGFFGADIISKKDYTQLWLVTVYHPLGSLYDFLNCQTITSIAQLLSIMKSIIYGISFLHHEVIGTQGKPAIAHRDIKSKNILMRSTNACCIADFGLAVTKSQVNAKNTNNIDVPQNNRVGTKRYMAPEVLNENFKVNVFDNYTSADIYSLGLVFWEVVNRLEIAGMAFDYTSPYQNHVSNDPSFEEMRDVVCEQKIRPLFPGHIFNDDANVFLKQDVIRMINECWTENPLSRLTSLRIKKNILRYIETLNSKNSN